MVNSMISLKKRITYQQALYGKTPKEFYTKSFQNMVDSEWDNANNVYNENEDIDNQVQVELKDYYGSKNFSFLPCRVTSVVADKTTGLNKGDDWKIFVFKPEVPKVFVGQMFKWQKSYWLCTNANTYESLGNAATVRRCNNVLKWKDKYGKVRIEPCVFENQAKQESDFATKELDNIAGFNRVVFQRNSNSNQIHPNQRFLFGTKEYRKCMKISGGGLSNYFNSETDNDTSTSLVDAWLANEVINYAIDDIENGIANAHENICSLIAEPVIYNGMIGDTTIIKTTVKCNDNEIHVPLKWMSTDENVAIVDENGSVTCLTEGSCKVKVSMVDNEDVFDEVEIFVVAQVEDVFEIRLSCDNTHSDYILQGETISYTIKLYKNNTETDDDFEITDISSMPNAKNYYSFNIVDGNNFSIANKLMNENYMVNIRCVINTESYSDENIYSFNLKGIY